MKKEEKLIRTIKEWCYANDWSEKLPAPTREVKKWVKIHSELIKDENERAYFHTLYSRLVSSKFSNSSICTIIEQELTEYEQNSFRDPNFCQKMQLKIADILLQDIYTTPDYRFQKAQTLIRKAKALRFSSRIGGLRDCIQCLSTAISIMDDISAAKCGESDSIHRQLCVAHCMRALCKQEAEPCSEQIFEDVKTALDLWHKIYSADSFEEKELCALPYTIMILMYNIVDLLQMKGFMELSNDACELLIEMFRLKSVPTDKWFSLLWESRRLNHALCVSPVDKFWINSFMGDHSTMTEFLSQTNITADEVCKIATSHHSTLFVGQLYLDLSRRLVAHGQLKEALLHAKVAYRFFLKEYNKMWKINTSDEGQDYISIVKEFLLIDSKSKDFEDMYLSPWKIIQCFLEGSLQMAIIHEMIGDGENAEALLLGGQFISCSLHFPLFMVVFSSLLGKLYIKKGERDCAIEELEYAEKIFKDNRKSLGCLKCKSILRLTLYEYLGDLSKSVEAAKEQYTKALNEFNHSRWKDLRSCLGDGSDAIPCEVMEPESLHNFINHKWEIVQRQLSMELHARLVKCSAHTNQIDEACNFLLRSIYTLVGRNSFCHTLSSISIDCFRDLVATEIPGDAFALQRAEIIQDICWYSLKYYRSDFTRKIFNLSSIKFEDLASWLTVAFILSREVPMVFQKVSKLLAVMYVVSCSSQELSLSSLSKDLDENYWASYFHQASIGTHFTNKFHSHLTGRFKGQCGTGSSSIREDTFNSLGLVPEATTDLPKHVKKFLVGLPSATIISISLLGRDYTTLLQELPLSYPRQTCVQACMLVSRLSFETEPVVILLPLDSISQDEGDLIGHEKPSKDWFCPSGFTVVDDTIPAFRTIIEEDSKLIKSWRPTDSWWLRTCLDERFEKLLRNLEDCWFGPWKCLLLGEWQNCKKFDSVLKNLVKKLRFKCKSDVNEGLLKIILGGSKIVCEGKAFVSQLCSKKCYIAKVGYVDEARSGILLNAADKCASKAAFKLLKNALNVLEVDDFVNRKPVILVLDYEVQMLPWESFPIVSNQEMYRMPSVSSIFDVLYKGSNRKEQGERNLVPFPSIDPLDAFYLIDPELDDKRDGKRYESIVEDFFEYLQLEGKVGSKPTVKEMISALKNHELFLYYGHGCASKYIPRLEIENLEKCAAGFLMGCSSGALTSQGSYAPTSTPLSYLLAGSPAIVANLWHVIDQDIDRFGFALFKAWWKDVSDPCLQCNSANSLSEEFEEKDSPKNNCRHRIGAFIPRAREACIHPSLTGASAICYGLPTRICGKKDRESHQPNKRTKFN